MLAHAKMVHDAARNLVLLVGRSKKGEELTAELETGTWTVHAASLPAHPPWLGLQAGLGFDPGSGRVLLMIDRMGAEGQAVHAYGGGGTWQEAARVEGPAGDETSHRQRLAMSFDPRTRRWIAYGETGHPAASGAFGCSSIDLSEVLDGLGGAVRAAVPAKANAARPEAPVATGSRWLKFQEEGGSDKFWFAEIDGSSVRLEWGRRGSKPQVQTKEFPTAEKAQAFLAARVKEKTDKGYVDAPEGREAAVVPRRPAWTMRLSGKGSDRVGGLPPAGLEAWPSCRACGRPLLHALFVAAHPERLPLERHAGLSLFLCLDAGLDCETWDPDSGANAAVLVPKSRKKGTAASPAGATPLEPKAIAYTKRIQVDPSDEEGGDGEVASQLGGYPAWMQSPSVPSCDECRQAMRFAGQLDELLDERIDLGTGRAYFFVCPEEHQAKMLWQCT